MTRPQWASRSAFVMAAIGSAVGLGNVWRFPYLAYKFGGGAFLIPYLTCLCLLGIPLLVLEFAVGQKCQQGPVGAIRSLNARFSGLGWFALMTGFLIAAYYAVVMAWALVYLVVSPAVPWAEDPQGYFQQHVLQVSDSVSQLGGINGTLLMALGAVWVAVYFCVWKGVRSVGKVVWITVPLPLVLLVVLLIRAVTLPGFVTGWQYYLRPDWSALLAPEVWMAAASQIFFTLTLGFGVMIAYASQKPKTADVAKDALVTALVNSAISLFAGFVVFGILGYMAATLGESVDAVAAAGPGLAFVVFPKALTLMPWPALFSVIFFLTLLTLGIDSAFSLVEAINVSIRDRWPQWKLPYVALGVCGAEFAVGIIFCTRAGLYLLDIADHFLTNYNLVLVGILEAVALSWGARGERLRGFINRVSDFQTGRWLSVVWKTVIPAALLTLVVVQFIREIDEPYEGYPGAALAAGWACVIAPLLLLLQGWPTPRRPIRSDVAGEPAGVYNCCGPFQK